MQQAMRFIVRDSDGNIVYKRDAQGQPTTEYLFTYDELTGAGVVVEAGKSYTVEEVAEYVDVDGYTRTTEIINTVNSSLSTTAMLEESAPAQVPISIRTTAAWNPASTRVILRETYFTQELSSSLHITSLQRTRLLSVYSASRSLKLWNRAESVSQKAVTMRSKNLEDTPSRRMRTVMTYTPRIRTANILRTLRICTMTGVARSK